MNSNPATHVIHRVIFFLGVACDDWTGTVDKLELVGKADALMQDASNHLVALTFLLPMMTYERHIGVLSCCLQQIKRYLHELDTISTCNLKQKWIWVKIWGFYRSCCGCELFLTKLLSSMSKHKNWMSPIFFAILINLKAALNNSNSLFCFLHQWHLLFDFHV